MHACMHIGIPASYLLNSLNNFCDLQLSGVAYRSSCFSSRLYPVHISESNQLLKNIVCQLKVQKCSLVFVCAHEYVYNYMCELATYVAKLGSVHINRCRYIRRRI